MARALFNNEVIAESDATVVVEGNHYFPPESVKMDMLEKSGNTYTCPWKGVCDYYDVTAGGQTAKGAAWIYPEPKEEAKDIAGYVAFWQGVSVEE